MITKNLLLATLFLFSCSGLFSQEEQKTDFQKKLEQLQPKLTVNLQLWAVYTNGMEAYNADLQQYETVDNRLNFTLHRSRYGLQLQPYKNLTFNFAAAMDFVGRDAYSALDPGINNGPNPAFRLWLTYLQLKTKSGSEKSYLTVGYFPLRIGRESLTNPLRSTTMEKAWSQNYLRRHLTGIGPGRAVGINWGGLLFHEDRNLSLQYDLGLSSPVYQSVDGNSTGKKASPLAVGRLLLMIGDPESKKYSLSHKPNYFGKRNGVSLGLAGAYQGQTDLFTSSYTYGADLLINFGQLNIDGDWFILARKSDNSEGGTTAYANTGYLRLSYNVLLKTGYVLEPVAALVQYNGEMQTDGQTTADLTGMPAGEDQHVDVGVNFYFNPDLKLALHYTFRSGDAGDAGDGTTINNYFVSRAGAVRYGDWLGVGLSAIF